MAENSIHPSLIFFEKGLDDKFVVAAVEKLHVEDSTGKKKLLKNLDWLRETNTRLTSGYPQIGLMFTRKTTFNHKNIPGFIEVPAKDYTA